jgi:hypothetical protein
VRVEDLRSGPAGDQLELGATVTFERPTSGRFPIWFRNPGTGAPAAAGDPYLPALLVSAMALHEDLYIDAPVSAPLLEAARERIAPRLRSWFSDFADVSFDCAEVVDAEEPPGDGGVGCLFSGGVDSWYSLLKHLQGISHLVFIHGFEIVVENRALRDAARKNISGVANDLGKKVATVETNAKWLIVRETRRRLKQLGRERRYFSVDCSFGSMLVACCLCLASPLRRVIVPSSWSGECPGPAGSHPLIEPNWSLPAVRFELDGVEARRIEKIRAIAAREPAAFQRLRVCVRQDSDGLNCGHCFKCVRTQMELRVAGVPDSIAPFPHPPDLEQLKLARFGIDGHFWPDLLRQAEAVGDDELARATRIMMGRCFYWPRFVDGWKLRVSRKGRKRFRMLRKYAREHRS